MDLFRVRLNCIDHYQATPSRFDPQLRNDVSLSQIYRGPKVPVVRAFGATETGQKACVHIHGAFPYLYIQYEGSLNPEDVGAYIYRLHLSIDHALAVSYRRNESGGNAKFVARITLVKGVPFYGFYVGYRFFLKIYMYDPMVMTRLAELLQQGAVLKRRFQPYESHLQYLAQFMIDYNLYGCDYLDSSKAIFRAPVPDRQHDWITSYTWHSESVPRHQLSDELPRLSHCSIEVDICVQHIANRKSIRERRLHHDFIERNHPLPDDVKLVTSMAGLWEDETRRRKRKMPDSELGSSPFPVEALVTMSADPRGSQSQGWLHEQEFRDDIQRLVDQEKDDMDNDLEFDTFVGAKQFEDTVNTVMQSVEDLYPKNLLPALGLPYHSSQDGGSDPDLPSSIEVDEPSIAPVREEWEDYFPNDSDEEAMRECYDEFPGDDCPFPSGQGSYSSPEPEPEPEPEPGVGLSPLSKPKTPKIIGLVLSSLRTGKVPRIPIPMKLVDVAEKKGYTKQLPKPMPSMVSGPSLKRKAPDASATDSDAQVKRLKQEPPGKYVVPQPEPTAWEEAQAESFKPRVPTASPMSSQDSASSPPSSDQGITGQTLDFPVVKDPNADCTKFRLSQQSSSSSSQSEQEPHPSTFDSGLNERRTLDLGGESTLPDTDSSFSQSSLPTRSRGKAGQDLRIAKVHKAALAASKGPTIVYGVLPPDPENLDLDMEEWQVPDAIYPDAYYGKEKDVPTRSRAYAGKDYRLRGNTLRYLPSFDPTGLEPTSHGITKPEVVDLAEVKEYYEEQKRGCSIKCWEIAIPPPTYDEVNDWWEEQQSKESAEPKREDLDQPLMWTQKQALSQIEGPTQKNRYGFQYSQVGKSASVEHEVQYMSTMSLELHVNTRGKLVPNPEEDEIQCLFWAIKSDDIVPSSQQWSNITYSGIIVVNSNADRVRQMEKQTVAEVLGEDSELDLMVRMVEVVRSCDPDVLAGYEVHGSSWGYLIERARLKYDYNLCDEFSRMKEDSHSRFGKDNDKWGFNTTSTIRITGRHMINIWRAMRGELNLLQYTMENVVWHVLHRRIPHYSWQTLTTWYTSGSARDISKILKYYCVRAALNIDILEANELIARTSEQARLLGVDFFSVISRGSQFKVESIMFRIAKPENFLLVSPSRKQVGGQNALECLPLVMEPESGFYTSPMVVLDFQSLYPSVMIAYNLCYSTFLGRITNWRGMNKMGFTEYKRQQGLLNLLKDYINVTPNGMMYTKKEIRMSLLAKMLREILETRVMVKSGMKQDKDDKALQQLLNNRQLALKLLANVTYGYTSASFSGRMPCSEIADSIVQTGRETLERAIAYIHSVERWGAEVVYGDTDSLFVYLKGKTRDQAFDIGNEMAKAITDMNPRPVKLKFEKVYHPCVLLAKKRYVGNKYETRDQVKPEFDAKGIETVRRDGTPAEQKIEEKALKMLFEEPDLSRIKSYFQSQCYKIMTGAISIQDFCFAREVKLGTYSDKGPPPAGALISTRRMLKDARAEPQYGERVPYVVVTGAPGARLIDRSVAPEDLLSNPHWALDSEYYISKNIIPPLERIFNLVGASVRGWYDEMPRIRRVRQVFGATKKSTLEFYMRSAHCALCNRRIRPKRKPIKPRPVPIPNTRPIVNKKYFSIFQMRPAPNRVSIPVIKKEEAPITKKKKKKKKKKPDSKKKSTSSKKKGKMPVANRKTRSVRKKEKKKTKKKAKKWRRPPRRRLDKPGDPRICSHCKRAPRRSIMKMQRELVTEERKMADVMSVCRTCSGTAPLEPIACDSKDCPAFWTREKQTQRLAGTKAKAEPIIEHMLWGIDRGELEW